MEEDQYRATYGELTRTRCVFEKALTNNYARCRQARHFWLADREGYACKCAECSETCAELLNNLREKSSFVLKLREVNGPLPHNMDIRVQVGGLRGLARLQDETGSGSADREEELADIEAVVSKAVEGFGGIGSLPYSRIIQSVEQFEGRRRRRK